MEFRVGSAPTKSLNFFNTLEEITLSGYLNRKCLQDVGGKRSKDRSWQCVWCHLKGKTLEFYRVDGVQAKPNGDPPPKDIYPPPNMMKTKIGFANLEGGVVELDYTSQLNKDLNKRRECLFRLQLSNAMEYLLQAPSDKQTSNWVTSLKNAAQGFDGFEPVSLTHQIRAARCSINKRSRQNVHSVKVHRYHAPAYDEPDPGDTQEVLLQGDLRLELLRKRLQSKRELLRLLEKMYSCFVIGNGSMYCDMPIPQSPEAIVDRRLSAPDQIVLTPNGCRNSGCHDDSDDCRSSTGEMAVPILHQEEDLGDGIVTEVLMDYYLVPGAPWSLLKSGERVRVVARMSGGWYRCIALRDANCQLGPDPSNTSLVSAISTSGLSELSAGSGQQPKEVQPLQEEEEEEEEREEEEEEREEEEEEEDEEMGEELVFRELSSTVPLRTQRRRSSFERPLSYQMATEEADSFGDYLTSAGVLGTSYPSNLQSHTRTLSHPTATTASLETPKGSHLTNRASMPPSLQLLQPDTPLNPKQARLSGLLENELLNGSYSVPLVGCIPPSALKAFAKHGSSPPSPHPPSSPTSPLPIPTPSPQHTPTNGAMREQNGDTSTVRGDASLRATSLPPPTIHHTPPPSPTLPRSPTPPPSPYSLKEDDSAPSPPPTTKKDPRPISNEKATVPSSLPSRSVGSTPLRKPQLPSPSPSSSSPHHLPSSSPSSSPMHKGAKSQQEPPNIQSLFDSSGGGGSGSFFKRWFAKRKSTSKQQQQNGAVHPSPSLPPPSPHPLLDDNFDPIGRVRVASVSGRSIRSTGVGLVIGEESSSEEEEGDEDGASTVSPSSSFQESLTLQDTPQLPKSAPPGQDSFELKSSDQPLKQAAKSASSRIRKEQASPRHIKQISPRKARQASSISRKKKHGVDPLTTPSDSQLNVTDIFRQPPHGEKRVIFLDPQHRKHGFRLESYRGRTSDHDKVLRTFVLSVAPGSPAFMAGLFPGDAILEVNGERVKYAPVEKVVEAITRVDPDTGEMIELLVEFVDGVTRLELMKKADELKFDMRAKQTQLRDLTRKESRHLSNTVTLPTPHSLTPARTLPPWGDTIPSNEPGPHPFPFNRRFNNIVSLYTGSVTQLLSNSLVIPLVSITPCPGGKENIVYQLLKAGGRELLDELCLSKQCQLGENIVTQGHDLPTTRIFHCVFGDLQESLVSACREALDTAAQEKDRTIVFWMNGFAAVSISPNVVVETVRLWLQEDQNSQNLDRIVFCGEDNLPQLETILEKYFPLLPFVTGIIPEETPSADALLGEVPGENLLEEKTAEQGGPEGENPNEKEIEGEIPGAGGDGDKGWKFPNDFDEKVQETGATKPVVQETGATKPVVQETVATKPVVQETGATKSVVQETGTTKPVVQETGATKPALQETVATKPVVQETGATKPVVQETVPTKPVVQEAGPTKPVVQETGATKPVVEEVIDLESITLELDNLQRAAQESLVELTVSQTSRDLDTLEKVAQEKMAELGSSEVNEELDALDQVVQQLMAEAARLSPLPSEPTRLSPLPSEPTRLSPLPSEPTQLSPLPSEPTRLSPLPSEPTRLSPLPSEPTRLSPLPSQPTRLYPLPSEPTRLSPLPSQPTRLSSQPKSFTMLPLPPSPLRMKRSPSDSLLPNPERTESDV